MRSSLALLLLAALGGLLPGVAIAAGPTGAPAKVYVLPIREDIMPPLVYLVRRGVKEAMENKAEVLVIDMETNGGRVDVTEEIIGIIGQFKGQTVTYVNKKAFSAGAFISFATQKIFMAPQSVIGAAAPVMMTPGGTGVEQMPDTMQAKMDSAISALVRANAEKNGHNVEVADAMVKKTKELIIEGRRLNEKGQLLTLTNKEAEEQFGSPPRPLLSAGTAENLDDLMRLLGYSSATLIQVQPTGVERIAFWINSLSPILLIIGMLGLYIEFKTPGFGLPGIVGIAAFALYFLGGYVAGLSGIEWLAVFVIGLVLVGLELFLFPGTLALGIIGIMLMLVAIVMALVDVYPPSVPGAPRLPTLGDLTDSLRVLGIAMVGTIAGGVLLAKLLPKTSLYGKLISQSMSGEASVLAREQEQVSRIGLVGEAVSALRPGGKARFGDEILDVVTQGDLIAKGQKVRIVAHSGAEAVVELVS